MLLSEALTMVTPLFTVPGLWNTRVTFVPTSFRVTVKLYSGVRWSINIKIFYWQILSCYSWYTLFCDWIIGVSFYSKGPVWYLEKTTAPTFAFWFQFWPTLSENDLSHLPATYKTLTIQAYTRFQFSIFCSIAINTSPCIIRVISCIMKFILN